MTRKGNSSVMWAANEDLVGDIGLPAGVERQLYAWVQVRLPPGVRPARGAALRPGAQVRRRALPDDSDVAQVVGGKLNVCRARVLVQAVACGSRNGYDARLLGQQSRKGGLRGCGLFA